MENIIIIKNLSKSFGEHLVLNKINLNVTKGEILGFLGPTGAGKTTLIKILTGQIKLSSGSAKVLNTETSELSYKEYQHMGVVMDNSGVYERLSCYDNLLLFTKLMRVSKDRIYEVLKQVELDDAINTKAKELSKGMRQRLILARAVLNKPKLLFLDEPTSGLDPATTVKIHELMNELKNNGTTIFLTTHNMEEATEMCDHVALLHLGELIEYGTPDEICRKYNTDQKIKIILKDGNEIIFQNKSENAEKISEYIRNEQIDTIHSSEPNLESIFISLTGKELV